MKYLTTNEDALPNPSDLVTVEDGYHARGVRIVGLRAQRDGVPINSVVSNWSAILVVSRAEAQSAIA